MRRLCHIYYFTVNLPNSLAAAWGGDAGPGPLRNATHEYMIGKLVTVPDLHFNTLVLLGCWLLWKKKKSAHL